jgi:DNA-binding PadR family transcriptional regulator
VAMPTAPRSSPLALTVLALLHYQPLHPYGIQRLIKQWGKDQVVNVEQRTSLYRTIERLLAAGLIAVRETERDPRYPERTVYEITSAGRQTARRWIEEMLAEPRQEYPEFPAALSHVLMLEPAELADVLDRRAQRLASMLAAFDANTAAEAEMGLPRIATLEAEYQRAVLEAEARWVQSVIADLRSGKLTWSRQELLAFAEHQEPGPATGPDSTAAVS